MCLSAPAPVQLLRAGSLQGMAVCRVHRAFSPSAAYTLPSSMMTSPGAYVVAVPTLEKSFSRKASTSLSGFRCEDRLSLPPAICTSSCPECLDLAQPMRVRAPQANFCDTRGHRVGQPPRERLCEVTHGGPVK